MSSGQSKRLKRRASPPQTIAATSHACFCKETTMNLKHSLAAAAASAAIALPGCAMIQSRAEVSPVDQQFMLTAASVGVAEIALGQLAMQQASDPAIKRYGQKMVDEHTRVNGELETIAHEKKVVLLKAMDPANRTLHAELSKLSGPAFDRQYMISQVSIHSMGNGLYESEARHGIDPEVRSFASRNTPVGVDHLRMAQSMMR
jgi:putative membrane protein